MMHTNPFSAVGYDLSDLRRQIAEKADNHEIHSLRGTLDRLERSVDMARNEHRSEIDGLCSRCEILEARLLALETLTVSRHKTEGAAGRESSTQSRYGSESEPEKCDDCGQYLPLRFPCNASECAHRALAVSRQQSEDAAK